MAEYSRRIAERTNGRVEIQMTSFAELGLAGPDTLRLIGDGTLEFGEVYSGYVGGDLVQSLGGEGQFIPFAEVYAALERGILDASVTEGLAGNGQRWYEVTDYLVGPIISLGNTWVVINQERWDTLPPDIQHIFLEESERHDRELLAYAVGEWERKAIDENVADGLIHQEFSPEMKRALRDAGVNQVIPQCVKRAGGPDSKAAKLFNGKNPHRQRSHLAQRNRRGVLSERETRRLLAGTTTFSLTPPAQVRKRRSPQPSRVGMLPTGSWHVWASISLRRLTGAAIAFRIVPSPLRPKNANPARAGARTTVSI